ncbi:hypothetical protein PHLCEN_2v8444 [Hermanssonia centrifuga]|uniref:Uncharacterized protein n=1 Tax=Hermanssonia centrifuga TaxID=98765 RepID=A0A2R6NTN3_9APHY|nr:hypothetical protein PHLCEN_2v8444 [Hermanssonia centrifuga]
MAPGNDLLLRAPSIALDWIVSRQIRKKIEDSVGFHCERHVVCFTPKKNDRDIGSLKIEFYDP